MTALDNAVAVGIDPGAACGWAVLSGRGARLRSGVWRLSREGEPHAMRFVHLRRNLRLLLADLRARHDELIVGYELPMVILPKGQPEAIRGRMHAFRDLFGYCGVIEEAAGDVGVEALPFEPSTIKKRCGSGRLGKDDLMAGAALSWPPGPYRSDEADSLWTADCARAALALRLGVLA